MLAQVFRLKKMYVRNRWPRDTVGIASTRGFSDQVGQSSFKKSLY